MTSGSRSQLDALSAFCDEIDVSYQNPHTFVLDESGLFPDFGRILEFKAETDPHGLLNPGKIGASFYGAVDR